MDALGRTMSRFRQSTLGATHTEKACYTRLVEVYRQLEQTDGRIETRTEAGHDSCQAFLSALQAAIQTLNVETASRQYRTSFTSNYRFLFPDNGLHYRIDVFEASIERHPVIWVNGDKFEFSVNTIASAETLQAGFASLHQRLDVDSSVAQSPSRHNLDELRTVLTRLDTAWAGFERGYICELIAIEAKARGLIVHAVEQERLLEIAEREEAVEVIRGKEAHDSFRVQEKRRQLISCIARLNSVANNRRKGRDDLDASILEEAVLQLRHSRQGSARDESAAEVLARDIVESFDAIRSYFRSVAKCLERVDPHLCNNSGLVERLVDWEESWEVGAKYVRHAPLFNAVVDVVAELREVEQVAPDLKRMCDDCDVELFLCIPRIIWLRYLQAPAECRALLRNLLPHHFPAAPSRARATKSRLELEARRSASSSNSPIPMQCAGDNGEEVLPESCTEHELSSLEDRFRRIQQLMRGCCSPSTQSRPSDQRCEKRSSFVWELLARRAVSGTNGSVDLYDLFVPQDHREAVREAVEALMLELEGWSMELQRHSAEDWNQCSSLLVRCLLGTITERTTGEFHV